jgi:hypothetical protein
MEESPSRWCLIGEDSQLTATDLDVGFDPNRIRDSGSAAAAGALVVVGDFPGQKHFSLQDLKQLPRHELGPTDVTCLTGRHVATVHSYAGARLIDVLGESGLPSLSRMDLKCCVIVASGHDGYRAFFSWNELFNSELGERVLVLYERDGGPLDPHMGDLSLISAADRRMGPRHLRHLCSVLVQRL